MASRLFQRTTRRTDRLSAASRFECESLESRLVFSIDFISAGFTSPFDGPEAISLMGSLAADGVVTAERFVASLPGPPPALPNTLTGLASLAGGGFESTRASGDPITLDVGSRFDFAADFSAGWLASYVGANLREFQVVVQRPEEGAITLASLGGFWRMHAVEYNLSPTGEFLNVGVFEGTATLSNTSFFTQLIGSPGESPRIQSRVVVEQDGRGGFKLNDDAELYSNPDGTILIYRDLDLDSDTAFDGNDGGFGILVRSNIGATVQDLAGLYRFGGITYQAVAEEYFGSEASDWLFELRADGTWQGVDLSDAERRQANTLVGSGDWTISGGNLSLFMGPRNGGGSVLNFNIATDGSTLVVVGVEKGGSLVKSFGIASRIPAGVGIPGDVVPGGDGGGGGGGDPQPIDSLLGVGGRNPGNDPIAFDLRGDEWFVADLIAVATGTNTQTADTIDFQVWKDPRKDLLFAAASTEDGLYVYRRTADGQWTVRNLTSELSGAQNIVGDITVFFATNDQVYIAGLAANGDLVVYQNEQRDLPGGRERWRFENIVSTQLTPKGLTMPAIVSPLESYVTAWNGLNVIGLDADGAIWSVWSGNGGTIWWANNLSEITGALPISGGLTAYLTSWRGINIAGIDSSGSLVITWWVPQFGADWVVSDITQLIDGPALEPASITSYVAPWGGLNVAGLNSEGEVIIYWWSPAREDQGLTWTISDLTGDLDAEAPRPVANLTSIVATGGPRGTSLNVFGDAENGDKVRLFFEVQTSVWTLQNVTAVAKAD